MLLSFASDLVGAVLWSTVFWIVYRVGLTVGRREGRLEAGLSASTDAVRMPAFVPEKAVSISVVRCGRCHNRFFVEHYHIEKPGGCPYCGATDGLHPEHSL